MGTLINGCEAENNWNNLDKPQKCLPYLSVTHHLLELRPLRTSASLKTASLTTQRRQNLKKFHRDQEEKRNNN